MRIGIDAGGTFTDFVVVDGKGKIEVFKLPSNPRSPSEVIVAGLRRAAASRQSVEVIHGSTVATNALLERKGARSAFVTTAGFEDLIHIGRQNRAALYDLTPPPKRLLVERDRCFGVEERTWADGTVGQAPERAGLRRLRKLLERSGVESVAICLLHSYQNPGNEQAVAAALEGFGYVSASAEVCPEFREYERASTTLLNAYVGPLMDRYLGDLERVWPYPIWILQSNGGLLKAHEARRHAVRTVLSGPAGGAVAVASLAARCGHAKALGFDMGGTSTDVSLYDGAPKETVESVIDGIPIRVPMLDIHTVGAGGGSIARLDEGGLLHVGPESAGADPGPACYGRGEAPTVTDAHVVLGRIAASQFLGGAMSLDTSRSGEAMRKLGDALGLDAVRAAEGVVRVANANMERAIRAVSIERGYDPREFALVAFGGCGGLHACEIAAEMGIRTVLAPENAGVLSALGMLLAPRARDYAAGVLGRAHIEERFRALEERAIQENPGARLERFIDVRYEGQSYELTIPWLGGRTADRFHKEHEKVYGYANRGRSIEFVTARVRAVSEVARVPWKRKPPVLRVDRPMRRVFVGGRWRRIPAWERSQLPARRMGGPALVLDYGSTTLIPAGWSFRTDESGTLRIGRE
jgi:N-methylhydantoinase A